MDKYNETSLLPKEKFFSKLKNKGIIGRHYKHVQRVYHTRNMKNLGEYIDVHCIKDCKQLID